MVSPSQMDTSIYVSSRSITGDLSPYNRSTQFSTELRLGRGGDFGETEDQSQILSPRVYLTVCPSETDLGP